MSRNPAGRIVVAYACLVAVPLLAFAQESSHPAVIAIHPAAAAISSSSSAVNEAALDLPDAPLPAREQNGGGQSQNPKPAQPQKTPPGANSGLTLQGLGFSPSQTAANAKLQALLNKRTHMLQIHQKLGLITLAPMVTTVLVSSGAKQKHSHTAVATITEPGSSGVDLHVALGSLTAALYGATAYYAIAAPKVPGVKPRGAIRLHRDLTFIHAPGMVLTPILGAMALDQENQGEKVHGIASAHQYVAVTTLGAYVAAMVAVSWPIHLKFWEPNQ
ncbi:MAG TPA: hypothetical protein VME18_11630 [Acidobacteriaceae bacterium]|nr:hypothetical protein [Acidobacteriaceae bacterium]